MATATLEAPPVTDSTATPQPMSRESLADTMNAMLEKAGVTVAQLSGDQCQAIRDEAAKPNGIGHGYFTTDTWEAANKCTRIEMGGLFTMTRRAPGIRRLIPEDLAREAALAQELTTATQNVTRSGWLSTEQDPVLAAAYASQLLDSHVESAVRIHGSGLRMTGASWGQVRAQAHAVVDRTVDRLEAQEN